MKFKPYHHKMLQYILKRVTAGSLVLDVGCGTGAMSLLMSNAGYKVEAIDVKYNSDMEKISKKNKNIQYNLVDICHHPLPFSKKHFQSIVCLEVLEHLRNPWAFIESVSYHLKDEGWLFLSIPNYWNVKYRLRYFFTGNIQQPLKNTDESMNQFRVGQMPHINTIPWPILKYGLYVYNMEIDGVPFPEKVYSWTRNIPYIPVVGIIKMFHLIQKTKQKKYLTKETNALPILLGGPHVFIIANKKAIISKSSDA